jgi:hypothetical protein
MALRQSPPWRITLAAVLALVNGGYMTVDSIHRFVFGDLIRIGGQLGPWSGIVSAVGIDPLAMGPVFLVLGVAYLVSGVTLVRGHPWGRPLVTIMAAATSWYLVFGTISSVFQLTLLWVRREPAKP